jgi:hypothetical protein
MVGSGVLLQKSVNYRSKKFYSTGPRSVIDNSRVTIYDKNIFICL